MIRKRVPIRDHQAEAQLFFRRAVFCMVLVTVVFMILLSNLYRLQVTGFQEFQTRSNSNRITVLPVAPNRGLIMDRNGELLAENIPVYSLEVIPEEVRNLAERLQAVSELLDIEPGDIDQFVRQARISRRFPQLSFADNLTEEQVARFAVNQHQFPGFSVEARLQRHYPHGELFTHAIGYVGRINQQDVIRLREQEQYANYAATRTIGKLGIERYYEDVLHGKVGYQTVEVNNRGRIIRTLDFSPPSPGRDIYLELDVGLQQVAKEQLQDRRGAIVVLDANTGGVLAMYSNPSYDPNWFVGGISRDRYSSLTSNPNNPLINRATQGRYPPASTVKPHLGLLGLMDQIVTPTTRIWDPGYYEIPGVERRFRDWRPHGHGWVDLNKAIVESCNTYYYDLSLKLGIDRISEFMSEIGFGRRTGLDIREENAALLPSRDWKRGRFGEPWYAGETLSVGIGQSYWTVTPIQMATTTQVLATQGRRIEPRLLKATESAEGLIYNAPREHPPIMIENTEHWQTVKQAMANTVSTLQGTAHTAFRGAPYLAAGKTGTAQVARIADDIEERPDIEDVAERLRDNATYIGYAPTTRPEIVVAIAIENVGGGGRNAAPVARALMDHYFKHQREDERPRTAIARYLVQPETELADADH
ncbi:MAG: penicillin-binding protein 2 [Idiomarina sp.]|nr:penicillin-binding protein 2 [Idiomarina sp.]